MWNFINKHPYLSVLVVIPTVAQTAATYVRKLVTANSTAPTSTGTKVTL